MPLNNRAKIDIVLPESVGTYERESMWAERLDDGTYKIANIPFFAYNVHMDDVVEAEASVGQLPTVMRVVRRSGQETLRIIFEPEADVDYMAGILVRLSAVGARFEKGEDRFFAASFKTWADLTAFLDEAHDSPSGLLFTFETGSNRGAPFFG